MRASELAAAAAPVWGMFSPSVLALGSWRELVWRLGAAGGLQLARSCC